MSTDTPGVMLVYSESGSSGAKSIERILITEKVMRIDAGPSHDDYTLFDRINKTLFIVSGKEMQVNVIPQKTVVIPPGFPINWSVESQTSHAVMRNSAANDSASATHHHFKMNQIPCYDTVVVNSVTEDVLSALKAYRLANAERKRTEHYQLENDLCRSAMEVFQPGHHLQYGFPIREWSAWGYQRFLVEYKQHIIFPNELFILPDSYTQTIRQ